VSSREHRQAMDLAAEAGTLTKAKRSAEAVRLYRQAAEWEQKAVDQLPADRPRTRIILGISLASLLYKARAYADARATAEELLRQADLPAARRRELVELVDAVERELGVNGSCTRPKTSVRPPG
jgi:hypothetical protein